jgi:hypothetical protein
MKTVFIISFLLLVTYIFAQAQVKTPDCSVLKNGTFKYMDLPDSTAFIVIKGSEHDEFFQHNKYYIKSKLKWVDDCSYIMTMTEITVPDFPFKQGDMMSVQVDSVENGIIYYTSNVQGQSWPERMNLIGR